MAAWVLLELSQSCCHPKDLAKSECHSCPKAEQANARSQELPANFVSLCSVQITWTPPSVSTWACCRPPAANPTRWLSKRLLCCPNWLSNWLAILKRAMREDEKQVLFSWILLWPITLSGIRAWHWSYSRPSLIDTWSASLSTLSQTAASSLKPAMGNAVASNVWGMECPKCQRLHLCCLISISVTSPTPCPPNMAMLMTWPSCLMTCFPTSVGVRWKRSFLSLCAWWLRLSATKTTCTAFHVPP